MGWPRGKRWASCALALGGAIALTAASPALASDWFINGSITNAGTSSMQNLPGDLFFSDAGHQQWPTTPIPAGGKGSFSFQADGFWEGADMYALYTVSGGTQYEVTAEDDTGGGSAQGQYAGCSENTAQGSAYVCSPLWTGTREHANLSYWFGPSASAPYAAAGQRCTGYLGGSSHDQLNCNASGQFSKITPPVDNLFSAAITFASLKAGSFTIEDTGNPSDNCQLTTWAQQCTLNPYGEIVIVPQNTSKRAWYGIEIVASSNGPGPPSGTNQFWPPGAEPSAPRVSSLTIAPGAFRPLGTRSAVISASRGAKISYRDSRPATTLFLLSRCASRRGTNGCAHWVTLGHRDARQSLTVAGLKLGTHCVRARRAGRRCVLTRTTSGQFLHHDKAGLNRLRLSGWLGGRRLPAGLYKVTATARIETSQLLSRPVSAQFRVLA